MKDLISILLHAATVTGTIFTRVNSGGSLFVGLITVREDFPSDDAFVNLMRLDDARMLLSPTQCPRIPSWVRGSDCTGLLTDRMWSASGNIAFVRDTGHRKDGMKLVILCGAGQSIPFEGSETLIDYQHGHSVATKTANSIGLQPGQMLRRPVFLTPFGRAGVAGSTHIEVSALFDQRNRALIDGNEDEWLAQLSPDQRLHLSPMKDPMFVAYLRALKAAGELSSSLDLITPEEDARRERVGKAALLEAIGVDE